MPEDGTVVQELPWYAKCSLDDVRCFIGANLKTVARCVVAVGYYLKQVRDRELWKDAEDAGYLSVWDFASREFGISKSTASRYMSINDRFSEGGDSPLILEKYAELSKSQLQEMLYLTDQQAEAVTPETTVQQIRAMRIQEPVEVLEGQMSLSDFLEDVQDPEEPETAESGFIMHVSAEDAGYKTISEAVEPCVVAMDDLIPEEDAAAVAISQQDPVREETVREPRDSMSLWERKAGAIMELAELSGDAWSLASDPPEEPGPTMVFYRRNNPLLHDADYMAGHRTNIVDCGDHYYEVTMRWFNGKCWAGYAEEVIMWQPLPELPKMFSFGGLEKPMRIYPPDSLIATHGCGNEDCSSCAEALCRARAEYRWCRYAPCGKPFGCTTMNVVESIRADKIKGCQFADLSLAEKRAGDGRPSPCCVRCENRSSCGYACGRAGMTECMRGIKDGKAD